MSVTYSTLSAAALETIAFETGLTDGSLNAVNAWNWRSSSTLGAVYSDTSGSAHKWGDATAGSSGGVVTYSFDPGSGFTAAQEQVFTAALTLWSDEANITFVEATDPATAEVTFSLVGSNSSGVPLDNGSYEYSYYSPGQIGSTVIPTITSASLVIDTASFGPFTSFNQNSGYGISTVVHEIGHLIGLGHAGPYNGTVNAATQQYNSTDSRLWTIMSYISPDIDTAKYYSEYTVPFTNWGGAQAPTTPQMLDILAAQSLYGMPTSATYAGGQIFGFNSNITDASRIFFDFTINTNPVVTIWDSGTGNTLDLSGFYTGSTVNLNPGSFSSVDGMLNNIGITYGTAIDTVIGGAGNDVFIVNRDNDTIDGGGGDNRVVFLGSYASYTVNRGSDGTVVVSNGTVTDTLKNIQNLDFEDETVAVSSIPGDPTVLAWTGGNYNQATSWTDAIAGGAAGTVPDANDVVLIAGPANGAYQTIAGNGAAEKIVFSGLVGITGTLTATAVAVGLGDGTSAALTIGSDADITAGSMAIVNGTVTDIGTLTVSGLLTVGSSGAATAQLTVAPNGQVQVGRLELDDGALAMGDLGAYLTIGSGARATGFSAFTVTDGGTLSGYGTIGHAAGGYDDPIIDNGTIIASGGKLSLPAVLGSGFVEIEEGSTFAVASAANSVGVTIDFLDGSGIFSTGIATSAVFGDVENFAAGDAIELRGGMTPLLQPIYMAGSATDTGILSVDNVAGNQVFSATLLGDFSSSVFLLLPEGDGSAEIITAGGSLNGSAAPSAGTAGSLFVWDAISGGDWNDAANWAAFAGDGDVEAATTVAPGLADDVVIGSPGDDNVVVVSGNGNAQALLIEGFEAFSGNVTASDLVLGQDGDGASLALIGAAALTAGQAEVTGSTLYVGAGTSLTVGGLLSIAASTAQSGATLTLYGGGVAQVGTLSLSSGGKPIVIDSASALEVGTAGAAQVGAITVDAGHSIVGNGTLSVSVYNAGTVIAEGGTLVVNLAAGAGIYDIADDATLSVLYQSGASVLPVFDFTGAGATLVLNLLAYISTYSFGTIRDFVAGETINFAAALGGQPTTFSYQSTGASVGQLDLTNANGQLVELTLDGDYQQSDFSLAQTATGVVSLTIACFTTGTRISTPQGDTSVEALQVGDDVVTMSGEPSRIVWIGQRHVDCRRYENPGAILPVQVRKGAFGPGQPVRDLYLSPDHAIYAKGVLIPVKHLINGQSITQMRVDQVTYWHVELRQHDIVLAEGLPVESYLDIGDRQSFEQPDAAMTLHPLWGTETRDASLIREAVGYAPLCVAGPEVEAVRKELNADDQDSHSLAA